MRGPFIRRQTPVQPQHRVLANSVWRRSSPCSIPPQVAVLTTWKNYFEIRLHLDICPVSSLTYVYTQKWFQLTRQWKVVALSSILSTVLQPRVASIISDKYRSRESAMPLPHMPSYFPEVDWHSKPVQKPNMGSWPIASGQTPILILPRSWC